MGIVMWYRQSRMVHGKGGIASGWKGGIRWDGEDGVRTGCDGESGGCGGEGVGSELDVVGWDWGGMRWEEDMTRRGCEWHRDRVECGGSWMATRMEWDEGSLQMESSRIWTRWDEEREET